MIDLNAATLWDVLGFGPKKKQADRTRGKPAQAPSRARGRSQSDAAARAEDSPRPNGPARTRHRPPPVSPTTTVIPELPSAMAERYALVEREMLSRYRLRVRKWRKNMSGVAWQVTYRDGSVARLIESPRPRGPVSASIFLHEVGHHAIGFSRYKPRCLEEYHAWMFSLGAMESWGLNVTAPVMHRVHDSLHYAIGKAARRGLKSLPPELQPYSHPRVRASR
ncbi:MAG: hypothetical protein AAF108_05805 [Planctomycetota bacterium]